MDDSHGVFQQQWSVGGLGHARRHDEPARRRACSSMRRRRWPAGSRLDRGRSGRPRCSGRARTCAASTTRSRRQAEALIARALLMRRRRLSRPARAALLAAAAATTPDAAAHGRRAAAGRARRPSRPASWRDPTPTEAALEARPGARARRAARRRRGGRGRPRGPRWGSAPGTLEFAKGGRLCGPEVAALGPTAAPWATGRWRASCASPTARSGRADPRAGTDPRSPSPSRVPRGRFFDRGRIEVVSDDPHAQSTSWLAAPC